MPARNYESNPDKRFHEMQMASLTMMTEMHGALSEIAKIDNPKQMKQIAAQTLDNVQNIAFGLPLSGGETNV